MSLHPRLHYTHGSTNYFKVADYLLETKEFAIAKNVKGDLGITTNKSDEPKKPAFPLIYGHQQWLVLPKQIGDLLEVAITISTRTKDHETPPRLFGDLIEVALRLRS